MSTSTAARGRACCEHDHRPSRSVFSVTFDHAEGEDLGGTSFRITCDGNAWLFIEGIVGEEGRPRVTAACICVPGVPCTDLTISGDDEGSFRIDSTEHLAFWAEFTLG